MQRPTDLISGETRSDENIIESGKGADPVIDQVVAADERLFEKYRALVAIKGHSSLGMSC